VNIRVFPAFLRESREVRTVLARRGSFKKIKAASIGGLHPTKTG
jgi:hypothetical protein